MPAPPAPPADAAKRPGLEPGLAWGAAGVLAFSVSLPATRLAVEGGLTGGFVGAGRAVVAGLLALATLAALRQPWPPGRMLLRLGIVSGGVVLGFPVLTSLALAEAPSTHGIIVTGLLPAATAVMAALRAGERPSLRFWLAVLAGVACVLAFAAAQGAGSFGRADALLLAAVLLCGLGYAEGAVLSQELGGVRVICLALVLGLPASAALAWAQVDAAMLAGATLPGWAGFFYLAVVSSYAGFFAWYRGLALGGVAKVGQLQLAQPVLSLGWAWALLGEAVTPAMAATAVAVLACVVATQKAR